MFSIRETDVYAEWLKGLRDATAKAKIVQRVVRLSLGNPGDVKPVGSGVSELRIHHGPGYRVYYTRAGKVVIVLLCGDDKSSQEDDIRRALALAADLDVERD